jgi:hypothetical protein
VSDRAVAVADRTIRALRKLSPTQRDVVVLRILESDAVLATVLPALRATLTAAHRMRLPLRRDGIG